MRVRKDDLAFIDRLWRAWSPGWTIPEARLAEVKRTLRHPGSLRAALSYYRQLRPGRRGLRVFVQSFRAVMQPVYAPALVLAGADDGCIGRELFAGLEQEFAGPCRVEVVEGAGHFMHLERPDYVRARVLEHLARH